ncbi:MAG: hypothetical protein KGL51_05265 [Betaproteobacteria bacterium]|nr:hypothetical protein [Betaproteobacteria bacterium]MDE2122606.1 hypothetical protein [Betaproteobacteria bacterium]MDE2186554.1 hypothetical protein [Betaproteobacteria bacterium]MDE2324066.1 hypothetical protein [Betaproteobacteria bacterium]
MKLPTMLHWNESKRCYIDPTSGVEVHAPRINWVLVAVQIIGGVQATERATDCVAEDIVAWITQGYVNMPCEGRLLASATGLSRRVIPVGCASTSV